MVQLNNSYARNCKFSDDNSTQICACDFRINIYRCDKNEFFVIASWISLILNLLVVLLCARNLYYLVIVKNQPMRLPTTRGRGFLRFRPLHILQLNDLVYSLAYAISMASLLCEIYPNVLWAEIVNLMPYIAISSMSSFHSLSLETVEENHDPTNIELEKWLNVKKQYLDEKQNSQLVINYNEVYKDNSECGQRSSLEIVSSTSIA
ncbi:4199_t:CDS:2 [Funneliformis caledonium]|uniref:4199_t:CDS:1 n=1 Tax=Funneliformis caledonium TaxID=1117310 RepID=A0A9N8YQF8_9GLOM|nr:4199_t:CDS:2 [Funneliformis caledonium]